MRRLLLLLYPLDFLRPPSPSTDTSVSAADDQALLAINGREEVECGAKLVLKAARDSSAGVEGVDEGENGCAGEMLELQALEEYLGGCGGRVGDQVQPFESDDA